jgi:DNA-binding CsgD family transcriptional regulator
MVKELRAQRFEDGSKMTDVEIARGFGMSSSEFRDTVTLASDARRQADINMVQRLADKGMSNVAIAKRMGIGESQVRALKQPGELDKTQVTKNTADILRSEVDEKSYIDVGAGVEIHMAVSKEKLKTAVGVLKAEGYKVYTVKIPQLGTNHETTLKVLVGPETDYKELLRNQDKITPPLVFSTDNGRTFSKIQPPISIDKSRVAVRYAEQGGKDADGVIYVRPGVDDLTLDGASYAQVRVLVNGTHYLKGMAVYKDDLPSGVDLMFNTNKSDTGNKLDALKPAKTEDENPFGSAVRQIPKLDENGKDIPNTVRSAMNIVNSEGDWEKWSKTLSSQMLSKQSNKLAKEQLGLAFESRRIELDKIKALDNPGVRKKLLQTYADGADASAVHLKAAALPKTASHIILPVDSMKENEVYAPNYHDGDLVVLIRHPHGGPFEIPELRVNNKHPEAKKLIGPNAKDAIGIHSSVAEKLSGADFDGDTVLVIPNNDRKIKTAPSLEGLKDFDPKHAYPYYEGMRVMKKSETGLEMGLISNLITDMTTKGAPKEELERAIRHSMVVIDAEKHKLNYKQSELDNGIASLKKRYQPTGGASTLISRSKSPVRPLARKVRIDPETGKKVYEYTGETYDKVTTNKRGEEVVKTLPKLSREKSTRMEEADDAHTLSSGTPIEEIYADHANKMKSLADEARKELLATKTVPYSPSAKVKYAKEVERLDAALNLALRNAPLERQAQAIGNAVVKQKMAANPDMDKAEIKKLRNMALETARARTQAGKEKIKISDEEWEAIQAGAITNHKLEQILDNADLDRVRELATPKKQKLMTDSNKTRALALLRSGYTNAEVASHLGVSVSTLMRALRGDDGDG